MADQRLNKTGLTYFWNRLKNYFATKTELGNLSDRVDDIVSEGGEPNVIETVKVNGNALTPDANKAVDISVITNSQVATLVDAKISTSISSDGAKTIASKAFVDANGGKIDKIKVNGTEQTITNKEVDITTPTVVQNPVGGYMEVNVYQDAVRSQDHLNIRYKEADEYVSVFVGGLQEEDAGVQLAPMSSIPTAVSDLTNDSGYQTAADVTSAIETKLTAVYKAKGSVAFASLPALTSANEGFVYNVTDSFTTTADFIEGAGKEYPAGTNVAIVSTTGETYKYDVMAGFVDLSTYWNATNLTAITTAEIDAIIDGE